MDKAGSLPGLYNKYYRDRLSNTWMPDTSVTPFMSCQ